MYIKENYYHIYNRGLNRKNIFFNEGNYIYCLSLIGQYAKDLSISVIAYCLMPNHYHLLLRQDGEESISRLIQNVFNRYVQSVNNQLGRSGTLFRGKSKHIHVNDDAYIIHLCRYIHLNPVEAGLVTRPEDWPFSNYREWTGLRNGSLKNIEFIEDYFAKPESYKKFVLEYQEDKKLQQKLTQYLLD